ncbi:tetratricopeptide repeat protein [bacterium]
MKQLPKIIILLILLLSNAYSKPSDKIILENHELTKTEKSFFEDLDDGKLDSYSLYDAALIASGLTSRKDFKKYKKILTKIKSSAMQHIATLGTEDPYVIAKELLQWLHKNSLKKYTERATILTNIFNDGSFNCLSASVLYMLIAQDLDLNIVGVLAPEHAFCMLIDSRGNKDIETTVKYGFDPGKEEIEQMKNETRTVYVPKQNYQDRANIDIYHLIGMLYSNRLGIRRPSEELVNEYFENHLAKFKKAYYFYPESPVFLENIVLALNNIALKAINNQEYDYAFETINQGKQIEPDLENWNKLKIHYYNTNLINKKSELEFEKAIKIAKQGLDEFPNNAMLKNNLTATYLDWAKELFENEQYTSAIDIYKTALIDLPNDLIVIKNIKTAYLKLSNIAYENKNYEEAVEHIQNGLKEGGQDKEYDEILNNALTNMQKAPLIDVYNNSVNLYNNKKYYDVIKVTDQALNTLTKDNEIYPKILEINRTTKKTLKIDYYNSAIKKFNKRDYEAAHNLLKKALTFGQDKEIDSKIIELKKQVEKKLK